MAKDGSNPNEKNLFTAAQQGKLDLVRAILASGTNVNAKDDNKMTALHHAALAGHSDVIKELLARGADVNAKNRMGVPAKTYATQGDTMGHKEAVVLLGEAERKAKYPKAEKQEAKAEKAEPIIPSQPRRRDQVKQFIGLDKTAPESDKKGPKGPRGG